MPTNEEFSLRVADSLDQVDAADWDAMAGGNPFVRHRFLSLMSSCGCAAPSTGWHPRFLLLYRGANLVGGSPCYLKTHSQGEFVFDHSWAQAFERHGLSYYPKLIVASPFTPVEGPRLLARDESARRVLAQEIGRLCGDGGASSAHALFVGQEDREALQDAGFMVREGVQFHWRNENYSTVQDFLARLSHDKRKKILQDGRYVAEAGIKYRWLEGDDLTDDALEFFYRCYENTYREHWSRPYLSLEFFKNAHSEKALDMVLMLAARDGEPVACALNVRGSEALYGRYWGTTEYGKGLHFETCYMQSISYCIANQIKVFEGGAQGEHKMARGLMPVRTFSAHKVADQRFAAAIEEFLVRERTAVDGYVEDLLRTNPFKT